MPEGRKRLEPRMTRGGFRWQLVMVSFMAVNAIVQIAFRWNQAWGAFLYLMLAMLIICAVFTAYLLYVRHYDGHFWDEDEARRRDWDRRGRQL
jgi:uncharacterized membrane protein